MGVPESESPDDDLYGPPIRPSRRSCAFCSHRASGQCDGDGCIRKICSDHTWPAAVDRDFCPQCEEKLLVLAATAKQLEIFRREGHLF
jgi:hypothetical protein